MATITKALLLYASLFLHLAQVYAQDSILVGQVISLEASNFPRHAINIRSDSTAWIDQIPTSQNPISTVMEVVSGLSGEGISFMTSPGVYLCERHNLLVSEKPDGTASFSRAATWLPESGISNQAGFSFRSFANRDRFIRHQGYRVKSSTFSGSPFPRDATWFVRIHPPILDVELLFRTLRFESRRFPGRFINVHSSTSGGAHKAVWIDNRRLQCDSFTIVPGLYGEGISFRTKDGEYLAHSGFNLFSKPESNTELFKKDATFMPVRGLSDPQYYSFKSVNYPTHFIHQEGLRLKISKPSSDRFPEDSTWIARSSVLSNDFSETNDLLPQFLF